MLSICKVEFKRDWLEITLNTFSINLIYLQAQPLEWRGIVDPTAALWGVPCKLKGDGATCLAAAIFGRNAFGFRSIVEEIAAVLFLFVVIIVFSVDAITCSTVSISSGFKTFSI